MERDLERRWELVLPHRDRLLRLARALVADRGDAEACVQEALTRCVTFAGLDESNVVAFLVSTTRRLCVDHHRATARDTRLAVRLSGRSVPEPAPDEVVCDRAEAAWVSARLADLPQRQHAVAVARAAGLSPQEIADRLAVSYKTVETLLYRVRTRARLELDRAYSVVLLFALRRSRGTGAAAALTSAAVVGATLLAGVPGDVPRPPAARPLATAPAPAGAARTVTPVAAVARVAAPPGVVPAPVPPSALVPRPAASPRPPGPSRCPAPPYLADPCVSPEPPEETPWLRPLDCVLYGVDREVGFQCRRSPAPSPTGSGEASYGGDS